MSDDRRYLIVNADDFGAGHGINQGIAEVHATGFLTSASLMVTEPAAAAAAEMSRGMPNFSVGLHTNLTGEDGPPLVDIDDPEAVRRELDRQLHAFTTMMGTPPSHLDAHHNLHRHPPLTPVFLAAAARLGIPLRENGPVRYFPDFYAQWDDETHPEQVSPENIRRMLREEIGPGITELSCHPGRFDPDFRSVYHRERELELATLIDPALPAFCSELGITLINYRQLADIVDGGRSAATP